MTAITQDQAQKRFLTIPPVLQDALFSVETAQTIDAIANANHLDGRRSETLASAVGWVFLGFLHPEEIKAELEQAAVPSQAAQLITNETIDKLFKTFGDDLDKTYAPLKEMAAGPMVIQDVNAPAAFSVKMSGQVPIAKPQAPAAAPAAKPSAPGAPDASQKPNTLSDVGWSKTQSSGPVVKLDASLMPPTAPAASQPKPAEAHPASPAPGAQRGGPVMGEFERMSAMKKAPGAPAATPTPAPTPASSPAPSTAPAPEPAPVMLHQDNTFTAAGKNTNFTLSKAGGAEVPIPTGKQGPSIPKPAVLEFGNTTPAGAPGASKGVVHYTDYKAPLAAMPTANGGQRNVSEITAPKPATPPLPAVPKPPTPPAAPVASAAPAAPGAPNPPAAEGDKVIVKNFY